MAPIGNPKRIGRYEILERIGRGGMGTVYRARDPHIGRPVAIKVLLFDDPALRARFRQEVQSAGILTHQHIVTVYEFGEAEEQPYLVMEYEGESPIGRSRRELPAWHARRASRAQRCRSSRIGSACVPECRARWIALPAGPGRAGARNH